MESSTLIQWGGWLVAALLSAVGVLSRRVIAKHDQEIKNLTDGLNRVADLERMVLRDYATRETVHELRNDMHVKLAQISDRIDANERAAAARHDALMAILVQRKDS